MQITLLGGDETFFFFFHISDREDWLAIFFLLKIVSSISTEKLLVKNQLCYSMVLHDVVKLTEDIYHHWSSQVCHFTCCGATHWVADQTITEWPGLRQLFHTRIDCFSTETTFWVVYNQKTVVLITHRSWQISKVSFLVKESKVSWNVSSNSWGLLFNWNAVHTS